MTNTGGSLDRASVSAEMTRYDGDIASAAGASGWTDVAHFHRKSEQWKAGERRVFDVRVPGNKVASPGTYLLRLSITRWVPSGTPREDLLRQLEHQGESPEKIADLMQRIEASNKELADSVPGFARIDLDTPRPGQYSGEAVSTVTVLDFVRVEPFSNVLSLFGVVVGALAAIATLALVILTWASL